MYHPISGFSKLSKTEKIDWILNTHFSNSETARRIIEQYWNTDQKLQKLHDEFIENTITNYYLPLAVAPNFSINHKPYTIPMVIEESSVVAAISKAAKFWQTRGGFKTTVLSTVKTGQVHFIFKGDFEVLNLFFSQLKPLLIAAAKPLTESMETRGGGIRDIELRDKREHLQYYYQLHASFETCDAMGANFINSCLEQFSKTLKEEALRFASFSEEEKRIEVIMSILSNYVPDCRVRAEVSCPVHMLGSKTLSGALFAKKFIQAITIAKTDPYRAVTHNKGVMNGVDAVILATGNDFRAVEAGVHAYAARSGQYTSLTDAQVENDVFYFWIEIPLALGTVGGLTRLHPLVKFALELLQNPSAKSLMEIAATAGLAQNFAAIEALITTGIQTGHMKMHLTNILNQLGANPKEKETLIQQFKNQTVTHATVLKSLKALRTL